jgi:hypothetical protein
MRNFVICTLHQIILRPCYSNNQRHGNEYNILENLKNCFEDLAADDKIILKWTLKKQDVKV